MGQLFDHVIYHGGCFDGFTAAYLLQNYAEEHDFEAVLHAGKYAEKPPTNLGGTVILSDFSYQRPELLEVARQADRVVILDHHKTAVENLVDLPSNVETVFDMNRSGAMITWDWLYPEEPAPNLVRYVQDRDLWLYQLPNSQEIGAFFSCYDLSLEHWHLVDKLLSHDLTVAIEIGKYVLMRDQILVDQIVASARPMHIAGYTVRAAPSPYGLGSNVATKLAEGQPFGAYYIDYPDRREFGLRSDEHGLDVATIAEGYGGGGHQHASGFRIMKNWDL